MIDDSLISFLLRMQGKNIGIRLGDNVISIGENKEDSPNSDALFSPDAHGLYIGSVGHGMNETCFNLITQKNSPLAVVSYHYNMKLADGSQYYYVTHHPANIVLFQEYGDEDGDWVEEMGWWAYDWLFPKPYHNVFGRAKKGFAPKSHDLLGPYDNFTEMAHAIINNPDFLSSPNAFAAKLQQLYKSGTLVNLGTVDSHVRFAERLLDAIAVGTITITATLSIRGTFIDHGKVMFDVYKNYVNSFGPSITWGTIFSDHAHTFPSVFQWAVQKNRYGGFQKGAAYQWYRINSHISEWHTSVVDSALVGTKPGLASSLGGNPKSIGGGWFSYNIPYSMSDEEHEDDTNIIEDFHNFILSEV